MKKVGSFNKESSIKRTFYRNNYTIETMLDFLYQISVYILFALLCISPFILFILFKAGIKIGKLTIIGVGWSKNRMALGIDLIQNDHKPEIPKTALVINFLFFGIEFKLCKNKSELDNTHYINKVMLNQNVEDVLNDIYRLTHISLSMEESELKKSITDVQFLIEKIEEHRSWQEDAYQKVLSDWADEEE